MSRREPDSTGPAQADEQLEVFQRLADEVRVLRDVLDELRECVSYLLRNPDRSGCSLLKRMGLDPTADNWGEQLVIVRGTPEPVTAEDISPALLQARETIRELLSVCELNLDELEDDTREVIQRAESVLRGRSQESTAASGTELHPTKPASSPASPGRLF